MMSGYKALLLLASATTSLAAAPAWAQDTADAVGSDASGDIIVTAQRMEQRLQDVPISITVFNQKDLANNNIVSAKDLAAYTPGLTVSTRFGNDATTFTLRGFSQELRTTSTVATYFADVVAPRGSGVNTGGDGAGPGQLFDLANVQVLKGPQGTLFGRNTTGGAVLLVPNKPTDRLEGYVEGSVGDYALRRVQAVLNAPIGDSFRVRLGLDRETRDGYLKNLGPLGRKDLGNIDYWAIRVSAVADLSADVENYTVVSYNISKNGGAIPAVKVCDATKIAGGITTGAFACQQIAREAGTGFWAVENSLPGSKSNQEQWQVINTTSWKASENLTIKNIFSYAELRTNSSIDLYGAYFPLVAASSVTSPSQVISYVPSFAEPSGGLTNAQSSLVEELQMQGRAGGGRLVWQAGFYFESNSPLGTSGTQNPQFTPCADIATLNCLAAKAGQSVGVVGWSRYQTSFRSIAGYAQASYDLTDALKLTGGLRYTSDRVASNFQIGTISFPAAPSSPFFVCTNPSAPGFGTQLSLSARFGNCLQHDANKTSAPTWLVDLDYKPTKDILLYAKYTRGYRQGGIAPASPDGLRAYDAEKVDTFEVGTKVRWRGSVPGSFNLAGFYNNFRNQQLQLGMQCNAPCIPTTAIVNAGKSRIYGFEAELSVKPFRGLKLDAAYSYLDSKLQKYVPVAAPAPYTPVPVVVGGDLPFAMRHHLTASANYTLPLPASIGTISIGGTFVYQSRYKVSTTQVVSIGYLPGYTFGNVNLTWEDVAGLPVDAGLFITNVTNEKMYTNVNDQSRNGYISYSLAEPRMFGARLRYSF